MKTLIITSGYFDPIHVGHLEYLQMAAALGDYLYVIVNNDVQCSLKKGKPFMAEEDRLSIVKELKRVDSAYLALDTDGSVCQTLREFAFAWRGFRIIFAKGGDRFANEIPERAVCEELGIELVDGLGKKIRSSSDLIRSVKE